MTKPVITTRAVKGSALTWTEGDANLENLRDATISVSADSGTTQAIDLNGTLALSGGLGIQTEATTGDIAVGLTNSGLPTPFTGSVTAIDGTADTVTLSSVIGLSLSMQIQFSGTNLTGSNITTGLTYYITNIDSPNNKIQINNMMSGAMDLNTIADTSGITFSASMSGGGTTTYKLQYSTSTGTVSWAGETTTPTTTNLTALGDVMITMPVNDGEVLTYDSVSSKWKNEPAGGGSIALDGLSDVTISGVANNHIIKYNSSTSQWENSLLDAGSSTLDALTDVVLTAPSANQVLRYSGTQWENQTLTTISSVSADSTPMLGGNLNVNGKSIVSVSNGNISIVPDGTGNIQLTPTTGKITLGSLDFPTGTGTNGQVLTTNGTSGMSWTTISSGATSLDGLSDVVITSATGGDLLGFDGTNWINGAATGISVGTAIKANTVVLTADNTTNATNYPLFVNGATGNLGARTDTGFTYNPSTGILTSAGFSGAHNGTVGATTPSTGAFTTLSASSTVSGAGFSTYLASPPAIGGTVAAAITGTTITANTAFSGPLNGTVGATTANTGKFTSLEFKNPVEPVFALTYAATITPDAANGSVQKVTLTGNVTWNAFTTPVAGESITVIFVQDATGSRTLTSTGIKWAGGVKTLSTAANSIDIATVYYDGTNYYGSLAKGFA